MDIERYLWKTTDIRKVKKNKAESKIPDSKAKVNKDKNEHTKTRQTPDNQS